MTNRKKRTCNGCRAYERIPTGKYSGPEYECSLHYPQIDGRPQQWCPKPQTVYELAVLSGPSHPLAGLKSPDG